MDNQAQKEKVFQEFIRHLRLATTKIGAHYFRIHVAGSEKQIFRERVYCYELYHQLREALTDEFSFELDGELDKRGHEIIKGDRKPDFVVHKSGCMAQNLAIIEVKPADVELKELGEDLKKLKGFVENANYYRGVMLIYGNNNEETLRVEILKTSKDILKNYEDKILVMWHNKPLEELKEIPLIAG
ncbi:MAG: hypothetical protein L0196_01760 [candidate division Zixibacteria bacterium]|nr:hypothetical protein [candidate division Zixibacteria bacterium]